MLDQPSPQLFEHGEAVTDGQCIGHLMFNDGSDHVVAPVPRWRLASVQRVPSLVVVVVHGCMDTFGCSTTAFNVHRAPVQPKIVAFQQDVCAALKTTCQVRSGKREVENENKKHHTNHTTERAFNP